MTFANIVPFDRKTKTTNVIIETPKGGRNKYAYDPTRGVMTLSRILPLGTSIAVARESVTFQKVRQLADLNATLVDEIRRFFVTYHEIQGRKFRPLKNLGSARLMT